MYKTAAALLAGVMLTHAAAWPLGIAPAAGGMPGQQALVARSTDLPLLLAQEPAGEPTTVEDDAKTSRESDGSMPVAQQIVAGILTGMLAAIITLRIVFYWRRNKDSR